MYVTHIPKHTVTSIIHPCTPAFSCYTHNQAFGGLVVFEVTLYSYTLKDTVGSRFLGA